VSLGASDPNVCDPYNVWPRRARGLLIFVGSGLTDLRHAQKLFDPGLIEADDCLTVNKGNGCTLIPHAEQLFKRQLVLTNILVHEINALLRKELLLSIAWSSARLAKDYH